MLSSVIGIVCIISIGYLAHSIGLCLVRGVAQALNRRPGLLLAMLMSGVWVGAYSVAGSFFQWPMPMRYDVNPMFILGGFLFGIAAGINQGCSVSTMYQFARGNIAMLFTMMGWLVGLSAWHWLQGRYMQAQVYQPLQPLDFTAVLGMFALALSVTAVVLIAFPRQRRVWLGISLIGLLIAVLFYIEPKWAPSSVIQDTGAALLEGTVSPSGYRVLLVALLLGGMYLSIYLQKDFNFHKPKTRTIIRHSSAGVVMGFGSAMALGGNDTQILLGLPLLSLGAIIAIISMILGIATEQFLYQKIFGKKKFLP